MRRNSNGVTRSTRDFIWVRDEGLCVYCGDVATELDHVIPPRFGGSRGGRHNLVLTCRYCNQQKKRHFEQMAEHAIQHLERLGAFRSVPNCQPT
jgi:5-methylcytosine-specific restriction endonuclease McrA